MPEIEDVPEKVLFIGAHPDDFAGFFAGTARKWIKQGAIVSCFIASHGCRGYRGSSVSPSQLGRIRCAEEIAAGRIIGVSESNITFAGLSDGRLGVTKSSREALERETVRAVRRHRPHTVVTLDPIPSHFDAHQLDNHPDHQAVGLTAIATARDLAHDPDSFAGITTHKGRGEPLQPHTVSRILLATLAPEPDFVEDISTVFDLKIKALGEHVSQSETNLVQTVTGWAAAIAETAGGNFEYGEAFNGFNLRQI